MTIRRKVQKVIDGDTFRVSRRVGGSQLIRIAGKYAPEKWQFGGTQATSKLRRQIQGRNVTLQPVGKSYGRTVAKVRFRRSLIR